MAEGRASVAMVPSHKRSQRDVAALNWTLESATDYREVEQFFDAVPAFCRQSGQNIDHVLRAVGSSVFSRSGPILEECLRHADLQSPERRCRAVTYMTALQAIAPKLPAIPMKVFTLSSVDTLAALRNDSDTTIAISAMCTTAILASSYLFRITEYIPPKSSVSDIDVADVQLLMNISEQLPLDELCGSVTVQDYHTVTSTMSTDATTAALRILRSDDVMDAAGRYLKFCRASSSMEVRFFFPPNPKFYDFESEGLTPSLDWISLDIIYEAENSVKYLQNGHNVADGWSADRAVWAISVMLRALRSTKMREEFWNCGRLMIINTLISQLVQSHHDTREHSTPNPRPYWRCCVPLLDPVYCMITTVGSSQNPSALN
ncbi:hypothetical protein BD410DRAFT_842555 [Rickenella mellea]|uniref:Uncharacterized protein n=1 Tax=Rickenella mellea TaxID=50990 RepID=A0A4Y7PUP9_9AGAM|nr:hypothetical protein BD410DRAFT_842555 [Rickenella mellea]